MKHAARGAPDGGGGRLTSGFTLNQSHSRYIRRGSLACSATSLHWTVTR